MIPERMIIRLSCDACGESRGFTVTEDRIDADGWDLALEGLLLDEGWGVNDRRTFCPHCMDRAMAMALEDLARAAERKASPSPPPVADLAAEGSA